MKQDHDGYKFKMIASDMLEKTPDKLLTQNQKNQNEKTIMVTTWHPALKQLPKILCEPQHIENDIYLNKVFPEKPIIAFPKKKSIRSCIVRVDIIKAKINERNPK